VSNRLLLAVGVPANIFKAVAAGESHTVVQGAQQAGGTIVWTSNNTEHLPPIKSMNPKVDTFLSKAKQWREEMTRLRTILLGCELVEEWKWNKPCYTFQNSNLVIIIPLKETCALMFCQGALLKDAKGILTRAGENTQAARWIKFTSAREIAGMEPVLKAYVQEAMAAQKAGLKVQFKKPEEFKLPGEFQNKLAENPELKAAFAALTPGRQRAYNLYFSAPKQSKTRASRVEKCRRQILAGKGLND
jgi:uncharacterized protein YdeI (YjbR/CyaY-like superfamily)